MCGTLKIVILFLEREREYVTSERERDAKKKKGIKKGDINYT